MFKMSRSKEVNCNDMETDSRTFITEADSIMESNVGIEHIPAGDIQNDCPIEVIYKTDGTCTVTFSNDLLANNNNNCASPQQLQLSSKFENDAFENLTTLQPTSTLMYESIEIIVEESAAGIVSNNVADVQKSTNRSYLCDIVKVKFVRGSFTMFFTTEYLHLANEPIVNLLENVAD